MRSLPCLASQISHLVRDVNFFGSESEFTLAFLSFPVPRILERLATMISTAGSRRSFLLGVLGRNWSFLRNSYASVQRKEGVV